MRDESDNPNLSSFISHLYSLFIKYPFCKFLEGSFFSIQQNSNPIDTAREPYKEYGSANQNQY